MQLCTTCTSPVDPANFEANVLAGNDFATMESRIFESTADPAGRVRLFETLARTFVDLGEDEEARRCYQALLQGWSGAERSRPMPAPRLAS